MLSHVGVDWANLSGRSGRFGEWRQNGTAWGSVGWNGLSVVGVGQVAWHWDETDGVGAELFGVRLDGTMALGERDGWSGGITEQLGGGITGRLELGRGLTSLKQLTCFSVILYHFLPKIFGMLGGGLAIFVCL